MVEKISETAARSITSIDEVSDKNSFFERLFKKKKEKKNADQIDIAALVQRHIAPIHHANSLQHGGNSSVDKGVKKNSDLMFKPYNWGHDKQQRNSILGRTSAFFPQLTARKIAGQKDSPPDIQAARGQKRNIAAVGQHNGLHLKSEFIPAIAATLSHKFEPVNEGRIAVSGSAAIDSIALVSSADAKPPQLERDLRDTLNNDHNSDAIGVFTTGTMQRERSALPQAEVNAQNEKPSSLQRMNNDVQTADSATNKKSMDLNYSFQRWSGDHSVKVSIPANTRREGDVTLLPSGTRAAEVISREIVHLPGYKPEILQPLQSGIQTVISDSTADQFQSGQDQEQRERQRQYEQQEEDLA
ncbi:hypothetical protein ACQYRI_04605 [Salmonella enterica]